MAKYEPYQQIIKKSVTQRITSGHLAAWEKSAQPNFPIPSFWMFSLRSKNQNISRSRINEEMLNHKALGWWADTDFCGVRPTYHMACNRWDKMTSLPLDLDSCDFCSMFLEHFFFFAPTNAPNAMRAHTNYIAHYAFIYTLLHIFLYVFNLQLKSYSQAFIV